MPPATRGKGGLARLQSSSRGNSETEKLSVIEAHDGREPDEHVSAKRSSPDTSSEPLVNTHVPSAPIPIPRSSRRDMDYDHIIDSYQFESLGTTLVASFIAGPRVVSSIAGPSVASPTAGPGNPTTATHGKPPPSPAGRSPPGVPSPSSSRPWAPEVCVFRMSPDPDWPSLPSENDSRPASPSSFAVGTMESTPPEASGASERNGGDFSRSHC